MKKSPGIPKGYSLNMKRPAPQPEEPVKLGDFLDEVSVVAPTPRASAAITDAPVTPRSAAAPARPTSKLKASSADRTRLNVSPAARAKLAAIVAHMVKYGPEPDVRASEVVEALVLALYDAREHLDFSRVRRRGKYGTPTHKSFHVALADSVADAFAEARAGERSR